MGFQTLYNENEAIRLSIKKLVALAFLPVADVVDAFDNMNFDPQLRELIDYFEDEFIGVIRRRVRVIPRIPIAVWNVLDRVQQNIPRTNIAIEGWHNALNSTVSNAHINCYELMKYFQNEQSNVENKLTRQAAGVVDIRRQAKYLRIDNNLRNLVNNYDPLNKDQFLRGVAYNIEF